MFIIRNAGSIVPPHSPHVGDEAATIEYAVAALKVKDIVVCGHTGSRECSGADRASANAAGGRRWLAGGTLRLHDWIYKVETGQVFAFDPDQRQFVLITEAHLPPPAQPMIHLGSI